MKNRKLCVITGTRAEYGNLRWLLQEIDNDPNLTLQLIVTGMHLSPHYGYTFKEIEEDGFVISKKIEMLLSSDTTNAMTKSTGLGLIGFADAFDELNPDIVIVLGDRYEIIAACLAATFQSRNCWFPRWATDRRADPGCGFPTYASGGSC